MNQDLLSLQLCFFFYYYHHYYFEVQLSTAAVPTMFQEHLVPDYPCQEPEFSFATFFLDTINRLNKEFAFDCVSLMQLHLLKHKNKRNTFHRNVSESPQSYYKGIVL